MKRFKKILYFADQPDTQNATLERAVALAKTNHASVLTVKPEKFVSPITLT